MNELPEHEPNDVLTTEEIAEIIGRSPRTVQRWCKSGKLAHKRIGYNYAIIWQDFVTFLETQE